MSVLLLVGTQKGLFRFRSDGPRDGWSAEPPVLEGIPVNAAMYEQGSGRVLAAANSPFYGPAVRRSEDLGATFDRGTVPAYGAEDPEKVSRVWELAAAPEGTLYAGVEASGLFRSRDGGETWQELAALRAHPTHEVWGAGFGGKCLHTVVTDPANPDRLYVAASTGGIYRSDDRGESWRPINAGIRAPFLPEGQQYPEAGQ